MLAIIVRHKVQRYPSLKFWLQLLLPFPISGCWFTGSVFGQCGRCIWQLVRFLVSGSLVQCSDNVVDAFGNWLLQRFARLLIQY
jgi:hypothetical protein